MIPPATPPTKAPFRPSFQKSPLPPGNKLIPAPVTKPPATPPAIPVNAPPMVPPLAIPLIADPTAKLAAIPAPAEATPTKAPPTIPTQVSPLDQFHFVGFHSPPFAATPPK